MIVLGYSLGEQKFEGAHTLAIHCKWVRVFNSSRRCRSIVAFLVFSPTQAPAPAALTGVGEATGPVSGLENGRGRVVAPRSYQAPSPPTSPQAEE